MSNVFEYFVLLANMRTGSNLFEQNIRLYPEFSCHGELFNPSFIGYPGTETQFGVDLTEREHTPNRLINQMQRSEADTLPGFRLFSDHDPRVLDHVLNDPKCAKIVLTRNPLDSFVSHAIARQTDQWKLTDVAKRKKAKVNFDFNGFKSYLERLENYLSTIRTTLQKTGQTAFYLRYEDLQSVDVFNGLAAWLDDADPIKELDVKIVRQNPESIEQKVSNFDEMQTQLRSLDTFSTQAVPLLEGERHPGSKNFTGGHSVPVLLMPMHRDDMAEVTAWLGAHELAVSGKPPKQDMNQKQLARWLDNHPERQVLGLIEHPVERAYRAFYRHIFLSGDSQFPWIRKTLENHYGMKVPGATQTRDPNRTVLENQGYGRDQHQAAFEVFLTFLRGNLQGMTRARVDQSWASQTSILQGYNRLVFPDRLVRRDDLHEVLEGVETSLGLDPIALPPRGDTEACFSLEEIYSERIEEAAQAAYPRDYQMFGFGNWR